MSQQSNTADRDLTIYQSAPLSVGPPAALGSGTRPPGATPVFRPASMIATVVLLAVLLICSLVLLVGGLALAFEQDAAQAVNIVLIALGGSLLIWHIRALLFGSGRRTAQISPWPWVGLVVVAAFGATMGFALFDLLTSVRSAARIALLVAGIVGMGTAMVAFVRDADIRERGLQLPAPVPVLEPEPAPDDEPEPVFLDPSGEDQLRPRGVWPQPKRGSAADASLWSAPDFEEAPAEPRRARRAAD